MDFIVDVEKKMLNCRLVVDVGNDFDSLNFVPFRLPYLAAVCPSGPCKNCSRYNFARVCPKQVYYFAQVFPNTVYVLCPKQRMYSGSPLRK